MECKVNKPGLKNEWFKDRKVVSSDEITYKTFKVENGTMYCMVIDPVNKGDAGCYSFYKENMKVAILKVEEGISYLWFIFEVFMGLSRNDYYVMPLILYLNQF